MTGPDPNAVDTSLIVPVFNGADVLLPLQQALVQWVPTTEWPLEVILVDDGSTDGSRDLLASMGSLPWLRLCTHASNRGKGAAVRTGMLQARGRYRVFIDVDLAYSLDQVTQIRSRLAAGAPVAIAARTHADSKVLLDSGAVAEFVRRTRAGRLFNRFVQWLVLPGFADTQAGLKGFTAAAAEAIFPRTRLDRFAFDVEILVIARELGLQIAQVPVVVACRRQQSSVRLGPDSWQMFADLMRIRRQARSGGYRAQPGEGQRPA